MADFSYLSLGGGVQSGCIAEMIAEGAMPAPDLVVAADTGAELPQWYQYIDYLFDRLDGIRCELVSKGNLFLDSYNGDFIHIPMFTENRSTLRRQCTLNYKIIPIERRVREVMAEHGLAYHLVDGRVRTYRHVRAHAWIGISLDEINRVKDSRTNWITNQYPLLAIGKQFKHLQRMSRADCITWLYEHNLPVPTKSACIMCPYHDNEYWAWLKDNNPQAFALACAFDEHARYNNALSSNEPIYIHQSRMPLKDIDFNAPNSPDFCESGYCFV